jgi:hypothetical protein
LLSGLFGERDRRRLVNWTKGLLRLWAVGSVLWATIVGLLLRDNGEEVIQIIALGPPLVIFAIGAVLVWAFRHPGA